MIRRIVFLLFATCVALHVEAAQTTIAVAANFTVAARDLIRQFEQTSPHQVKASFASTGKLYAQIEHGAPFEIFLAADARRPMLTEESGTGIQGTRFTYARGKLVLWSNGTATITDGKAYLSGLQYDRLAIANPKTAPYGLAAQQVLEHLQLWDQIQSRLIRGDSITQTYQFVASGNVQAGFIALSQLKGATVPENDYWLVPDDLYEPIDQQAILLRNGEHNPAAIAFMAFLHSSTAKSIIAEFGYGVD